MPTGKIAAPMTNQKEKALISGPTAVGSEVLLTMYLTRNGNPRETSSSNMTIE